MTARGTKTLETSNFVYAGGTVRAAIVCAVVYVFAAVSTNKTSSALAFVVIYFRKASSSVKTGFWLAHVDLLLAFGSSESSFASAFEVVAFVGHTDAIFTRVCTAGRARIDLAEGTASPPRTFAGYARREPRVWNTCSGVARARVFTNLFGGVGFGKLANVSFPAIAAAASEVRGVSRIARNAFAIVEARILGAGTDLSFFLALQASETNWARAFE